jgi:hypothetical protein
MSHARDLAISAADCIKWIDELDTAQTKWLEKEYAPRPHPNIPIERDESGRPTAPTIKLFQDQEDLHKQGIAALKGRVMLLREKIFIAAQPLMDAAVLPHINMDCSKLYELTKGWDIKQRISPLCLAATSCVDALRRRLQHIAESEEVDDRTAPQADADPLNAYTIDIFGGQAVWNHEFQMAHQSEIDRLAAKFRLLVCAKWHHLVNGTPTNIANMVRAWLIGEKEVHPTAVGMVPIRQIINLLQEETITSTEKIVSPTSATLQTYPTLSRRKGEILMALGDLQALSQASRKTTEEIANRAEGKGANPESYKKPLSQLVSAGLLESAQGRDGGYWLTETGLKAETEHREKV